MATKSLRGYISAPVTMALGLSLSLCSTGCLSSLAKHNAALLAATTPVIDQAATAYRGAQALHDARVDYEAVVNFEATSHFNPKDIVSFPSDQAIQIRLTVLEAFKCYVQSLVEITSGVESPKLDAAAKSVGGNLTSLGNTLGPTIQEDLGIAPVTGTTTVTTITSGSTTTTTSATEAAALISTKDQSLISTSALALGEFLVSRKIKKELPQKIKDMDPKLKALCELLEQDIDVLQGIEQKDTDYIRDHQEIFAQGATALDPQQRRVQILKLPAIIRQRRAQDQQLAELRAAILKLYMTHHALADDAQGNNPQSLKAKLSDLATAGSSLGKFYSSLPTQ